MDLQITNDDVQAVLSTDPMMALKVQNQALIRAVGQLEGEVGRLTEELANCTAQPSKEKHNAASRT